jgi:tetratricopeptide (TPR) repeat protein
MTKKSALKTHIDMKPAILLIMLTLSTHTAFSQTRDALAEYAAGNYEAAVNICNAELAANPANLESFVVLSWSLVKLNRFEEARTAAVEGRKVSYYDSRLVEILGEISYYQGRNSDSLRFFQEYLNLAPEGQRVDLAYYYIGEIFIRTGRYRHADISFSTALHYVPGNADWWTRLGYAREIAGELTQAVDAYQKALTLNARHTEARRGLDRVRQALAR